jgi:glutamate synthase (NADPH/NADH) small chain
VQNIDFQSKNVKFSILNQKKMGNPTGFLQHTRQLPSKQPVAERLQHYREFVGKYSPEQLNQQSGRCMNCGVPFCHSGCPLGNVIPEFNDAVYRGQWEEAYQILTATNNFPEFTGRICPAPCESACVLGINQPPVAIEEIEKHIIEIAFERGYVQPHRVHFRTGKRVAVVGSGPAGLAAAARLNSAGHAVTVFERDAAPGGLLRYGIPDFKLEKTVVERRIRLMESEGIVFQCITEIGRDISGKKLLRDFDAVVLAIGSTVPRDLKVPGRDLEGVRFAMDFLKEQNLRNPTPGPSPEGRGGRGASRAADASAFASPLPSGEGSGVGSVIVIGGGDTGSDCVGTANRRGATSVTQFELLPEPPKSRTAAMPWPTYPMLLKTSTSQEEGCARQFAIQTKAFLGDAEGRLRAVQVVDLEWKTGADGRPSQFEEVPGSARELPCDLALLAMGFLHPQHEGLLAELGVELDGRGNVLASEQDFETSVVKVFVAGDARRGQSLVVWAISEGRECARRVDEFLMGHSTLETKDAAGMAAYF